MIGRENIPWSADGRDLWVFAYGSLMWNPEFNPVETRDAALLGYHRSLCIFSHYTRGTPENPGLVFGLDEGGQCHGRALSVAAEDIDRVVETLYEREMPTNVYCPTMARATIEGVGEEDVFVFVANTQHRQYAGTLSDEETALLVSRGHGPRGACLEYVASTANQLHKLGVPDQNLDRILELAKEKRQS